MRSAVIFDWGGVLMRTEDYQPRIHWDKLLGLDPGGTEKVVLGSDIWRRAQLGDVSLENYWQTVGSMLSLTGHQLSELRGDFYSGDKLDQGLVRIIRWLKQEGIPVGLLSNNTSDLTDTIHDLGLESLFNKQVISANIGIMKPDPAAYHVILRQMAVDPSRAIFIDDFIENVEGAKAVGMEAVHFSTGVNLGSILEQWLDRMTDATH